MQKWEYLRLVRKWELEGIWTSQWSLNWADGNPKSVEERLKELGLEGWELIQILELTAMDDSPRLKEYHYYFKRSVE